MARDQRDLLLRLVGRTADMDEPQGADRVLFGAFEAWSAALALKASGARASGIVGRSMLQGNLYICIIGLGTLIDKPADLRNSLRATWRDCSGGVRASADEVAQIKKSFDHPESCPRLKGLHDLRHNVFAHNRLTRVSIDNESIERALHFSFRCWFLLSEQLTDAPMLFPFKSFHGEDWMLDKALTTTELRRFQDQWEACQEKAKQWLQTPLT